MSLGNLLAPVIVQGASQGLSQALSATLSGAISGSLSNLVGGGLFNGLSFTDPALQAAIDRAQGQIAQPAAETPPAAQPPAPNEVAPLEVEAPAPPPPLTIPGGAVGQVLGGAVSAPAPTPAQPVQQPPTAEPERPREDTVFEEPVVVTGNAPQEFPTAPVALAGGALGAAQLLAGGGGGGPSVAEPTEVEALEVEAPPKAPTGPTLTPADLLLPAAIGGGLLTMGGGSITPPSTPQLPQPDVDPPPLVVPPLDGAGGGGTGGGGFSPTDLLPLAPLIPLLTGGGGGGGNSDALRDLANNASGLANRLGNVAAAGFAGDIGGRGLNSISRMVRKAQAAIRQRYSSMGMSGSSAEGQDLQAAADAGVDLMFKVGQEQAVAGLNAIAALTGQSASIYTSLLNAQTAKNTALGNAIANFAASLVK